MKVYAHYFKSKETENEYRWRTLLQFGTSWEVIGSIVMVNPGSSRPVSKDIDEETLCHLRSFSSECDWFVFSVDNTMQHIENLFRAYYETQSGNSNLNGVIQIFNLMNIREPNMGRALERIQEETSSFSKTVDKDITKLIAPVYLGWGKSMNGHPCFREDQEKLFQVVYNDMNGKYLHANFNENLFYHPRYMMGRGKNRSMSKKLFHAFCQNTENPSY